MVNDPVNHPKHYTSHPSGVECIQVTEHMGFNLGNAVKYIWRADEKGNSMEDLAKAAWYVQREIAKRESNPPQSDPKWSEWHGSLIPPLPDDTEVEIQVRSGRFEKGPVHSFSWSHENLRVIRQNQIVSYRRI